MRDFVICCNDCRCSLIIEGLAALNYSSFIERLKNDLTLRYKVPNTKQASS